MEFYRKIILDLQRQYSLSGIREKLEILVTYTAECKPSGSDSDISLVYTASC
jgi:hypothetical protein